MYQCNFQSNFTHELDWSWCGCIASYRMTRARQKKKKVKVSRARLKRQRTIKCPQEKKETGKMQDEESVTFVIREESKQIFMYSRKMF